jgi:predicted P-loop ATPase
MNNSITKASVTSNTSESENHSINSSTNTPSHINSHHFQEWLSSGVSYSITSKNIHTIHDSWEVDKVLNRNNKSRTKHSDHLVPCWCVSGVNPMSGEPTLLGVQIKPDTPTLNKDGKYQKYIGASNYDAAPLFLNTGVENFWKSIIEDKKEPIFLTEGAKKAGAGLSVGYTTISIPGVSTCRKKGRLHPWLELFTGFGRVFYLAFDNDVMAKRQVQTALLGMAREIAATGSKVMVVQLPPGELKGIDDFIVANGKEAFKALVDSALTIEEWHEQIKDTWREQLEEIKNTKRSKLGRYMEILKLGWGHELRYNELKSQVELLAQPIDFDQVRLRIALEFDIDVPIQDAQTIVENLAKENSYHPVSDYLDGLARQYPQPDLSILDDLAFRYFGTNEPLHNLYLRKTLIAAVARVKETTVCKHDEATILVGGQGIGKSTFWEKLFSTEWFCDELGDANEKDELMKLHRFWGLEWAEFETVYKRKEYSALKKFMTTKVDPIRTPYSRSHKEFRRKSVLVGTTNEQEILADPTGSRRFWIIPVSKRIPTDLLKEERDRIWAAAYALYRSGEKWFLDWAETSQQEELNKDYQTEDPWGEIIQNYLDTQSEVTIGDIFHHLSIEPAKQDVGTRKRITAILHILNWESTRKFLNGKQIRVWQEKKIKVDFSTVYKGKENNDVVNDTVPHSINNDLTEINVDIDTTRQDQSLETVEKPNFYFFNNESRGAGFAPPLPAPIKIKFASPLGEVKAIATPIDSQKWEFHLIYPDATEHREEKASDEHKAHKRLKSLAVKWQSNITYRVSRITQNGYEWVEGCKCIETKRTSSGGTNHTFKSPSGEEIYIYGNKEDFEVM